MTLVSKTFELYGKTYTFESGELAKQATGACLVKQGDTTMLDTVVVSKERKNYDFFPLTVDFNEKMYAAGRIPGGYLKREGRPSEKATLTARMIDRPIRPSFPDGFRNEVHIVATSLVADQVNPFDVINVMGASLAMTLGGVPFEGPLACVRIGRNVETGEFIVNPTYEERENSDLDLELGGSADFISMVEAGARRSPEDDMLAAMKFGQEALAAFCQAQDEFVAEWEQVNGAIVKKEYPLDQPVEEVQERIFAHYDEMAAALRDADKLSRIGKVEALKESIRAEFTEEEQSAWEREIPVALKKLEKKAMRTMVVETGERVDGRAADEIRPIMVKDNYLPLVHGSGLFQRGQTRCSPSCRSACSTRASVWIPSSPPRQALYASLQLPAVLHRRDRAHGQPQAPRDRPRQPGRARPASGASRRERVPLRHPRGLRGHGVQRLLFDGFDLRLHARPYGRRRAH